jgi:Calx-beta domain-containing protein
MPSRLSTWSRAVLAAAVVLLPGVAVAQVPPILVIGDAGVFEGNAGTTVLSFPVTLTSPANPGTPVTGLVSGIPLTGSGFNPATGGLACGGGVDFIRQTNVPFSIPPGATSGSIPVVICGDSTVEPNEHIFLSLGNVNGAQCLEGTCNAVGTIRDDDGPPTVAINNISVSEFLSGSRTAFFTVSLSHPSGGDVSVNFATRNGAARGAASCAPFITGGRPDFISKADTLTIPAGAPSATIGITICGDTITESDETFFVDLSSPAPVGVTITDPTGQGTIRNAGATGAFDLAPDLVRVHSNELIVYQVVWTVPAGEVWRDLSTIDFRLRGGKTALWVRWDEPSNTFALCERVRGRDHDDDGDRHVSCGAGAAPGSAFVLQGERAQLHLAYTSAVGSGPTGPSVTLQLGIVFTDKAEGHTWNVELGATDDFGQRDRLGDAGTVQVIRLGD